MSELEGPPRVSFIAFIYSLASNAAVHFGDLPDPMTGEPNWALVDAPGGGFMGVHSRSDKAPIKTGNFLLKNQSFQDAQTYADWKFVHSPPGLPARVEKSAAK